MYLGRPDIYKQKKMNYTKTQLLQNIASGILPEVFCGSFFMSQKNFATLTREILSYDIKYKMRMDARGI